MKKELIKILLIVFYFLPINSFAEIKPISDGSVDAKIKLIVFESLTCGHCGSFHKNVYPKLKEDFIDKGHVYIEFKNFPLDDKWSFEISRKSFSQPLIHEALLRRINFKNYKLKKRIRPGFDAIALCPWG